MTKTRPSSSRALNNKLFITALSINIKTCMECAKEAEKRKNEKKEENGSSIWAAVARLDSDRRAFPETILVPTADLRCSRNLYEHISVKDVSGANEFY